MEGESQSSVPVSDQTSSSDPQVDTPYVSPEVQAARDGYRVDFSKEVTDANSPTEE